MVPSDQTKYGIKRGIFGPGPEYANLGLSETTKEGEKFDKEIFAIK